MPTPSQAVTDFSIRSVMPQADVFDLDGQHPGYLDAALAGALSEIYSRLRKRYRVPMDPIPEIVLVWQALLVTPQAYRARGANPDDPTIQALDKDADRAREQMKEAADSQTGLYDLPLNEATDDSAVSKAGPLAYSEQDPYSWQDIQSEAVRGR